MSRKPEILKNVVVSFLKTEYNIYGKLTQLPSERDQNFYVQGEMEVVCKISQLNEDLESLEFQNSAITHLNNKEQSGIPVLIPNKSGKYLSQITFNDKMYHVRVLSYLPGKVIADINPHSKQLLHSLGDFLGEFTNNLQDFNFPNPREEFYWSLKSGSRVIKDYRRYVAEDKVDLLRFYDQLFAEYLLSEWENLPHSIVHNDANDYNIIVNSNEIGLIDFGDMVYSFTLSDLVIGTTYLILGKKDPLLCIKAIIQGYTKHRAFTELEMKLFFPLICLRLCQSVSISSYQSTLEPDNDYLLISQRQAWESLEYFKKLHPNFVYYFIRDICGLDAYPNSNIFNQKISDLSFSPIIDNISEIKLIDQGIDSLDLYHRTTSENDPTSRYIYELSRDNPDKTLIGRYNELRYVYLQNEFSVESDDNIQFRNIHLGIDLYGIPGTTVRVPMEGEVHGIGHFNSKNDWGTIVFVKHNLDGIEFYTLYGHLAQESVYHLKIGAYLQSGDKIGEIGEIKENGEWPPHVHFQIVLDLLYSQNDFPGVCRFAYKSVFNSICPDPKSIVGIVSENISKPDLIDKRKEVISSALSLSYNEPLTIVRGYMQYLFDNHGNRFLDAVNNVPHVGHSHPNVVKALIDQARVLNTNTRYLHPLIIEYSEKLLTKFPDKFEVCFFVNSGSEANELALRMAKTYTKSENIIVLDHAYHGNTNSLIQISPYKFNGPGGQGKSDNISILSLPDPYRPKYENVEGYIQELDNTISTILPRKPILIVEAISGVGGQIILEDGFLSKAFQRIKAHGGISIADEVQIGFGRIGSHFWGFELYNAIPDIVTLGKPIGNGHPLGAVITTRDIAQTFANGMEFFSTFGGNPVSCAVGLSVLDTIEEEKLQSNSFMVGQKLIQDLLELKNDNKIIGDVRGVGLFVGIELVLDSNKTPAHDQASYIVNRMKDKGVLLSVDGPFHNVIKIKPPICFNSHDVDYLVTKLKEVLKENKAQIN